MAGSAETCKPVEEAAAVEAVTEEAKPAEVVAVEYKDLKLPEGVAADDALASPFLAEAAKLGLPQAQVEALLAQVTPKIQDALKAPYQEWVKTQTAWQSEVMNDPEIGGDNFATMKATVAKVLDNPAFCDPGLREALNFTGAGNNPVVIRSLFRMAQKLTEGGLVRTGNPAGTAKTAAQVLYPDLS